ncbi:MAG: transglutaminase domain-containing protein [Pseudomonadota bacterium]
MARARSASALAIEAKSIATTAGGGGAALRALANHVAGQFRYGHPEKRFYDGFDEIPQICGLAEGSCVDINAYFIASCRAAGLEAGYITGCFVPQEKRDWCNDMHCWVVTRSDAGIEEWDIAHHLKLCLTEIAPGLNPKPGVRVPLAHSMGLNFPAAGLADLKLIGEPMWRLPDGRWQESEPQIRLARYDLLAAA